MFVIYKQLRDEERADANIIKMGLYAAFAINKFIEYDQLTLQQMHHDKSVNMYVPELWKDIYLEGVSDCILRCLFAARQPTRVKYHLHTLSRMNELSISQFCLSKSILCATITIVKQDFSTKFDHAAKVSTTMYMSWRQQENIVSLFDLRKAYLQVHIHKLWPFQAVLLRECRYFLM